MEISNLCAVDKQHHQQIAAKMDVVGGAGVDQHDNLPNFPAGIPAGSVGSMLLSIWESGASGEELLKLVATKSCCRPLGKCRHIVRMLLEVVKGPLFERSWEAAGQYCNTDPSVCVQVWEVLQLPSSNLDTPTSSGSSDSDVSSITKAQRAQHQPPHATTNDFNRYPGQLEFTITLSKHLHHSLCKVISPSSNLPSHCSSPPFSSVPSNDHSDSMTSPTTAKTQAQTPASSSSPATSSSMRHIFKKNDFSSLKKSLGADIHNMAHGINNNLSTRQPTLPPPAQTSTMMNTLSLTTNELPRTELSVEIQPPSMSLTNSNLSLLRKRSLREQTSIDSKYRRVNNSNSGRESGPSSSNNTSATSINLKTISSGFEPSSDSSTARDSLERSAVEESGSDTQRGKKRNASPSSSGSDRSDSLSHLSTSLPSKGAAKTESSGSNGSKFNESDTSSNDSPTDTVLVKPVSNNGSNSNHSSVGHSATSSCVVLTTSTSSKFDKCDLSTAPSNSAATTGSHGKSHHRQRGPRDWRHKLSQSRDPKEMAKVLLSNMAPFMQDKHDVKLLSAIAKHGGDWDRLNKELMAHDSTMAWKDRWENLVLTSFGPDVGDRKGPHKPNMAGALHSLMLREVHQQSASSGMASTVPTTTSVASTSLPRVSNGGALDL
eukprot:c9560_g1_i1.p1 GENE.c9560_g1_i1~~c9560_g1_i1.p1  ORF type:complete len:659 (+),score=134.78 c9560_g1_i1:137-2113(+)